MVAGEKLTLEASGKYVFHAEGYEIGPEGMPDAVPFLGAWPANELTGLALIGKIGDEGVPFLAGARAEIVAPQTGELYLMVNDDILEENSGTLTVEVTTSPAGAEASETAHTLEISEVGLRMTVPAGWQPGGVSGESVLAYYSAGSSLYPGLSVTIEDRGGRTLDQLRDGWLALPSEATVRDQQTRTISSRAALFIDASWSSLLGGLPRAAPVSRVRRPASRSRLHRSHRRPGYDRRACLRRTLGYGDLREPRVTPPSCRDSLLVKAGDTTWWRPRCNRPRNSDRLLRWDRSRPRRRSLECHGRDGVILLS